MSFQFNHLHRLCQSIGKMKKSTEHFIITFKNVKFDCILNLDAEPYELMIGAWKYNFACILHIKRGYKVDIPELDYRKLRSILELDRNSAEPFSAMKFLLYLDQHLPKTASPNPVDPRYLAPYKDNELTQAQKEEGFIFCGWLQHQGLKNGHVTEDNLQKTEVLLGKRIAAFCRKQDISSKWTTDSAKSVQLTFPEGYRN